MNGYRFPVFIVHDDEGWSARCPEFPDCRAQGATYEDVVANIRDVIQILIEDGLGDDELVPQPGETHFVALNLSM